MTDIATLNVKVTSQGIEVVNRELDKLGRTAGDTERKTKTFGSAFSSLNGGVDRVTRSIQGLGGALAGLGIGLAARQILSATDTMASFRGQLALVTDSQEQLNSTYERALTLANSTGQSLDATVNLYARLARSTEELSLTSDDLFTITQAINQSFIVSGAAASEAASATLQLSQGLAAGALRGEELNSVMENSPRLARALADGLGVTIGQLREMGAEGELTAEAVTGALLQMSDSIDKEFQEMPMTVGRASQEIKNLLTDMFGSVDSGPVIDSLHEIRDLIGNPQFQQSIQNLTAGFINMIGAAGEAMAGFADFSKFLGEEFARRINGIAVGDIPALEGKLHDLNEELAFYEKNNHGASEGVKSLREEIALIEEKLRISRDLVSDATESTNDYRVETEELTEAQEELEYVTTNLERIQRTHLDVTADSAYASNQAADAVMREAQSLDQLQEVVVTAERVTADFAVTTAEAAKQADPFADAFEAAVERIDSAFADAWKGAFDSFSDFADGLKNAFKQLMAELAHAAITKPIIVSIAGSLGIPGYANAATSMAGAGGIGSALSSIGSMATDAVNWVGGLFGAGSAIAGASAAAGAGAGAAAGIGGGLGAVGAGGAAGGAAAGAAGGGLLAGVGAALPWIGGGLLAADLLGLFDSKPSDKRQRTAIDLATGESTFGGFTGDKFSQENRDASEEIANALANIAVSLGVDSGNITAQVGGRTGLRYRIGGDGVGRQIDGQQFGSVDELLADAIYNLVGASETLEPAVKRLIRGFDGTTEEVLGFAEALVSLSEMSKNNPVDQAIQDFAKSQEDAGSTLYDSYQRQIEAIREMTTNFDGSARAATDLSTAMANNQQAAYQLALGIQQISESVSGMFTNSAQSIRESQMTSEERIAAWKAERRDLRNALPGMVDPERISEAAQEIDRLNTLIFNALGPNAQAGQAEAFAVYAETTNEIAQNTLDRALRALSAEQENLNSQTNRMLNNASQDMQRAADTQMDAANIMLEAMNRWSGASTGGPRGEVV